jgi:BASS family bile acid:Na+ symporter
MTLSVFVKNLIMFSVFFLMLGVGLRTSVRQVADTARQIRLVAPGVLANFLVVPALTWLVLTWIPLSPDIKIGIMLLAAAPIAPMAPPFVSIIRGDLAYSVGLMTIAAVLSAPLTPLILSFTLPASEAGLELPPLQIIKILLTAQIIPIGIGIAIQGRSEAWAGKLARSSSRIGQVGLTAGVVLILAFQAKQIVSMGPAAHVVILLVGIGALLVGDRMLTGESAGRRRALAVSTTIRNIPLALLVATGNFAGSPVVATVLAYAVYCMIIAIVYGKLTAERG